MKAIVCHQFGPLESLSLEECPDPIVAAGEVVLDVKACAVNFPDVLTIQNQYQVQPSLPFTPGSEVAGVVSAVQDAADGLRVGDRVFAMSGLGGLAEKVTVAATACTPMPDNVGFVQASAFLYSYGTPYYALHHRAQLQPEETLLVLGAAGGVGLAAVELGALHGSVVIAAASSEHKLDLCRQRGAAMTIDYSKEDLKQAVRDLTGGAGADVVFDAVGGPYSELALRATAWNGRFLVVGFAAGGIPAIPLNLPLLKGCQVMGVYWGGSLAREPVIHERARHELMSLWEAGRIGPHISGTYPLARAGEALGELRDRKATGRVVVTVD